MQGRLIAFEGLDQSGKRTQTSLLRHALETAGRRAELLAFPDYTTAIGAEIAAALADRRQHPPDVLQLLFIANRHEHRERLIDWLTAGAVVICDRYIASSVAYGEAHDLDPDWLETVQCRLPQPDLTLLLDIEPRVGIGRKRSDRDRFERDLELLRRVRESYRRQAERHHWAVIDGSLPRTAVTDAVQQAVRARLGLP